MRLMPFNPISVSYILILYSHQRLGLSSEKVNTKVKYENVHLLKTNKETDRICFWVISLVSVVYYALSL
jgi:hypothetical protein